MRRLPLYILVDNSSTTVGKPIQQVNDFIGSLIREAKFDPYLLESLHVSVLEYGGKTPQCILELEVVDKLKVPLIQPTTNKRYLGKALDLIIQKVKTELIPTTSEQKGDWKYTLLIFLFGESEDNYLTQIEELKTLNPKPYKIIILGLNKNLLDKQKHITELAFNINEIEPKEILMQMTGFIEDSIKGFSEKINN